jgi:hypothetical protein
VSQTPIFILILGSYDPDTKKFIYSLKDEVAKVFDMDPVYSFVLDKVEWYTCNDSLQLLTEIYDSALTIMSFSYSGLLDIDEIKNFGPSELDSVVIEYARKKYNINRASRAPVTAKLTHLMEFSRSIFLIREKEETRGGEYCELIHAMAKNFEDKIVFFCNENITLSSMVKEYLDAFNVRIRYYSDLDHFKLESIRYLNYRINPINV